MSPKKRKRTNISTLLSKHQSLRNLRRLVCAHETDYPFLQPFGLSSALLTANLKEVKRVVDIVENTVYSRAAEFLAASQLVAIVKKYPFEGSALDRRNAAEKKFLAAERLCKRYNLVFSLPRERDSEARRLASQWIQYVLGEVPDVMDLSGLCDFGPGASLLLSGLGTSAAHKLQSPVWSVTPCARAYIMPVLWSHPQIREFVLSDDPLKPTCLDPLLFKDRVASNMVYAAHNKIAFVPKTAWIDRTIAVEPLLNGYLQKGVDVFMRRRLKRVGIDLSDQTRNQELARLGSLHPDDGYVTIDLSDASDSISIGVVRRLLSADWFNFLNRLRSPSYLLNKEITTYEKFVSMGNGFCFPLETLIFASLCQAAYVEAGLTPDFSVYGDDIIVKKVVAERVLELLRNCGFRYNAKKTFLTGGFRESCGADWLDGVDVRPISLKSDLVDLRSYFKFHNLLLRKQKESSMIPLLRGMVPLEWRFMRPLEGNPDSAFQVPLDVFMASPHSRWCSSEQRWRWKEIVPVTRTDSGLKAGRNYHVLLLMAALRGGSERSAYPLRRASAAKVRLM